MRNLYPQRFIERNLKKYLDDKIMYKPKLKENKAETRYFKLPYIGDFSEIANKRIIHLFKRFCKNDKTIQIVFNVSKIRDYFSNKDSLPKCFRSFVVYHQFTCANCGIRCGPQDV